ncbi:hypothetical protein DLAC_11707 [Tieghemostelium lacteum]|uniref:RRM domain-containing protein n=1 Tax=Tieghemostelium lacteum TaxID=361077 RepID=A0A151ZB44_TIELA|nr:hypothetical protein DLAC_11707 [Tieghemostelium lacteum]|eukprot:KYQ91156.1 hypothetical protein DLAC_11707 [Tieghemostelium lacteum]
MQSIQQMNLQQQMNNNNMISPSTPGFTVFVGHIPSTMNEDGLKQLFEKYGNILDITIMRDKRTNFSKGCAFISFNSKEEADLAMDSVNNNPTYLENMNKPLQVKYSDNEIEKMERKLFIGMTGSADETQITQLFSRFGTIEELTVVREKDGKPKGYGFIKFSSREESENAIRETDGKQTLPGSMNPVIVKFADTERQKRKKMQVGTQPMQTQQFPGYTAYPNAGYSPFYFQNPQISQQMNNLRNFNQPMNYGMPMANTQNNNNAFDYTQAPESNELFIYYLPPLYGDEELKTLFSKYGNVLSSKVFIDRNTNQSKCFGFVTYDNTQSAHHAIKELNGFPVDGKKLKVTFKRERN